MTLAQYAQTANYCMASATGVIALAFLAYLAQWAFARERTPVAVAAGAETLASPPSQDVAPEVGEERPSRYETAGSIALSLTALGWLLVVVGVITRGLAAERVPWGNMYEFAGAGVLVVLSAYLVLVRVWGIDWLGPIITGFCVVILGLSILVYVPAGPIVPALHSYWLVIHVLAAMIAGSAFLVGAGASILYLVKARAEVKVPEAEREGILWRMPAAAQIDKLAYRIHAFAFPVWTFAALIAGPIWAQYAWGKYWGWDPKETWAFITWVIYAGYLHARVTAGWKGKAAAIIALVGFATFLFNFIGVNLFIPGLHSYAK